MIDELAGGGPAAAKDWARDRGLDPAALIGASQRDVGALRGANETHVRGQGGATANNKRPRGAAMGAPPAVPAPVAAWRSAEWATPEVQGQIANILEDQGDHRDERSLLAGKVMRVSSASGGTNETTRVELSNGMIGYHKSFGGLNDGIAVVFGQDSAQQPIHEAAAWHLAKRLGGTWEQIVPPVVVREVNGQLGSFALERPGRPMSPEPSWQASPEWESAAFFDSLIGQQDRHAGNFLLAGDRISLIDHGYAFARPGDAKNYSRFQDVRVARNAKLTDGERAALDRLIASPDTLGMDRILEPKRAEALRARAKRMRDTGRIIDSGSY